MDDKPPAVADNPYEPPSSSGIASPTLVRARSLTRRASAIVCLCVTVLFAIMLVLYAADLVGAGWGGSDEWLPASQIAVYVGLSALWVVAFASMAVGLFREHKLLAKIGFVLFLLGVLVQVATLIAYP